MKTTTIQTPNEDLEHANIDVSVLLGRVAIELSGIAESASSVQHALGRTMDQVSDLCDVPIIEFQALDRMQQKLEDLSKLSILLSDATNGTSEQYVTSIQLRETLRLTSLTGRLEGNDADTFESTENNGEGNLTLF
ncbi:hypothetical protein AB9F29_02575 [Falsihalocynthiibacter sp. S25ZX9]|uniref:hypothetical protein n=1 Tax=Falsihalocynthiibacter sp. S25ZX9 TaxID=3240870 RepID=UPI00350FB6A0